MVIFKTQKALIFTFESFFRLKNTSFQYSPLLYLIGKRSPKITFSLFILILLDYASTCIILFLGSLKSVLMQREDKEREISRKDRKNAKLSYVIYISLFSRRFF